jgi:hypothetical protein
MGSRIAVRPLLAILASGAMILAAANFIGPDLSGDALAQTAPVATHPIQIPPPVPGVDYSAVEAGETGPAAVLPAPATPVPPGAAADATGAPLAPEAGGSLTASLGGSDVAVESVGGSYEVDAPGRRGKRGNRD